MSLPLSEVVDLLRSFEAGALSRHQLEWFLADRVMQPLSLLVNPTRPPHDEEESLAYELAKIICAATGPDEDVTLLVHRVLDCLTQLTDPEEVSHLLPLILFQDEFSVLVSKHCRGVISSAGMRSVIQKHFRFDAVREVLEIATPEGLQTVCDRLESGNYVALRDMLLAS